MTYEEAIAYLGSFANYEESRRRQALRRVKLERMRRVCERLGNPQRAFRSILVAGTNAKGSISAIAYSILRQSTLRVGLYTSPHLESLRERIRVWSGGLGPRMHRDDWITEEAFASAVSELQPVLDSMRKDPPTYFEAITAAAFLHFRRQRIEVAVLEVGLGGRLDATNVVQQAVSVIGPIGLDHAEVLGKEPERIAKEKAAIIKSSHLVLTSPQPEPVLDEIRAAAEAHGALLAIGGRDLTATIQHHGLDGLQLTLAGLRGIYESVDLPLVGRHQAMNAVLAVAAVEALSDRGIPHAMVEEGLAAVEWPGRLEVLGENPLVLIDGAHNPPAAAALRATLEELAPGRKVFLLVGMSVDKAVEAWGEQLGPIAHSVTCTKSRNPRSMDPTKLAKRLMPYCHDVHVITDPADAYTYILNVAQPGDVLVVTGSLFLVGEVRLALQKASERIRRTAVA